MQCGNAWLILIRSSLFFITWFPSASNWLHLFLADGIYCQRFSAAGRWGELVGFVGPCYWWSKIQAYKDDPGTSVVEANSCNHAAWSNLKWKLVPLDGAQAQCVQGDNLSFREGIKTRLKKKIAGYFFFCISRNVIFTFSRWMLVDYTASVFFFICCQKSQQHEGALFMVMFKRVLSGQIRTR